MEDGGLGFSTSAIGTVMTIMGAALIFWQLLIYPRVERRFGAVTIFRYAIFIYGPCCAVQCCAVLWCAVVCCGVLCCNAGC